jgi:hypothetical protein
MTGGLLLGVTHVFVTAFSPAGALSTMAEHRGRALRDALLQMPEVGLERGRVQRVLATKMAVEGGGRDPEIAGDVLEARSGVAVPVEPRPCCGEDRRASVPRSGAHLVRHGASLGQRHIHAGQSGPAYNPAALSRLRASASLATSVMWVHTLEWSSRCAEVERACLSPCRGNPAIR